jgi:hypothetical protein
MASNWDWAEYNTLAQQMVNIVAKKPYDFNLVSEDAIYRCVIGRAYYSAHCQAANYLENIEFTTPLRKDIVSIHQWVIDKFDPEFHNFTKDIRNIKRYIHQDLFFLRKERVLADYKKEYPNLKFSLANQCIKRSCLISEKLIELSKL